MMKNIAVFGATGAIGSAIIKALHDRYHDAELHAFSQAEPHETISNVDYHNVDYHDEETIVRAAQIASQNAKLDMVVVATGILHEEGVAPEKSLRDLSADKFQHLFAANTIAPALIAKHFLPQLRRDEKSVFAALSARVGSISDNRLGGWYAYRASKAALNMIIKNAAIEMARTRPNSVIVGLHPGTVDSELSKPFQANVKPEKLFTPEFSANKLIDVITTLTSNDTGKCFDWDGKEISP